ncbi:hypothetical protein QQX98_000019 [Neonectria punicea]|uniref:DUF7791 domain-containing protein n=1 Tax=Neonectria punicea TaxID=979145 RepID=A0ABR1HW51_9HYPO
MTPFFKYILDSVPSFYREKIEQNLQMALEATEPLDSTIYSLHDDDDIKACCALQTGDSDIDMQTMQMRREQIVRRLNGRCRGLLEKNFLGQIDFLHRTVADFLRTREMSDFLCAQAGEEFSASLAILKALFAWIKMAGVKGGEFSLESTSVPGKVDIFQSNFTRGIRKALGYVASVEADASIDKATIDAVLDDMDRFVTSLGYYYDFSFSNQYCIDATPPEEGQLDYLFRELILEKPLLGYFSRKILEDRTLFSVFKETTIFAVLFSFVGGEYKETWPVQSMEKLTCVLQCDYDPNQVISKLSDETIWERFLSEIVGPEIWQNTANLGLRFLNTLKEGLFQPFLEYGADPDIKSSKPGSTAFEAFLLLTYRIPSDQTYRAAYLLVLECFIGYGAKFHYQTETEESEQKIEELGADFGLPNHPKPFFERLEETISNASPPSSDQLRFLEDVCRRILPLAHEAGLPLDSYKRLLANISPSSPRKLTEGRLVSKRRSGEMCDATSVKRGRYGTKESI